MGTIRNLNCILVLDPSIRPNLKSNISNLTIYGVEIIDDIRHITKKTLERTKRVVILGGYRYDGLDDLKLHKELLGLDYYFISDDKLMISLMSDYCKCYYLEYSNVSSNLLYSVLFDDKAEQNKYEVPTDKIEPNEVAKDIMDNTDDPAIVNLCRDYIKLRDILADRLVSEETHLSRIRQLESQVLQHLNEINNLNENYKNLVEKVMNQSKILKDYEIYLASDIYEKIPLAKYKKRPKIIYLKEYQEMIHENSFIITLFNTVRLQGKMSCKVVRLHDSCDLIRIKSLEDSYKVINSQFLESDIITSDFILSYGNYKKLFDLLLTNKYELDVLIVIDCKKYDSTIMNDAEMVYFNICRNKDVANHLGLSEVNTINNNSDTALSWDTYQDYEYIKDDGQRLEYLSSRPVIRRIYSLLHEI